MIVNIWTFVKKLISKDLFLALLLLFISGIFRISNLSTIPPGIHGDEAEFGLINNAIRQGSYDNLFSVVNPGIFSYPVISFLPQAWIYNLFGRSLWSLRLSSALIGTVAIIPFYFLVKTICNQKVAFFSSLFLASSSLSVAYSRMAVNIIYSPVFLIATLYPLFLGIKEGKIIFYVLSGIILGAGLYSYLPFKIVPIIILLSFLINLPRKEFRNKHSWGFILLFFTSIVVFSPQIRYYFSHPQDLFTRPANILIFKTFGYHELYRNKEIFFSNIIKNILVFPFGKDDGYFLYGIKRFGLFSPLVIILFLVGLLRAFKNLKIYFWQVLFLGVILTLLAISTTVASPASQRLLIATPIMFIFAGYGLYTLLIINHVPKKTWRIFTLIALLLFNLYWDFSVYFRYYINSADGWAQNEPATQIAYYLKSLGPSYHTYMLREKTLLYFNHGTIKFLNPGIKGKDVEDSSEVIPLKNIENEKVVYIMPPDSPSLDKLKSYYPYGKTKSFVNPRNKLPSFVSYEIDFSKFIKK